MKKRVQQAALLLASLAVVLAVRLNHRTLCPGFLPENDMKIPVGDANAAGIERGPYDGVLDRIEAVYGPIIAAKGGKLVVKRLWEDPTVNASAQQSWGNWVLNMYGGLARHAAITEEGFALVACHEIGHHLGGYPKMRGWATNEGGSDYFATLKCLRLILPSAAPSTPVDPQAEEACSRQFSDEAERNACRNNAVGGQSTAFLFQALRGQDKPPQFGTPDTNVVDTMMDAHPDTQCRMDTYLQGALCSAPLGQDVDNADPTKGACTRKGGYQAGFRPRCWYKPPADEPVETPPAMVSHPQIKKSGEKVGLSLDSLKTAFSGRGV